MFDMKEYWQRPEVKELHNKRSRNRITYKGKRIYLEEKPRLGLCELCDVQGYTHIHHVEYDESDVLKNTVELCPSCHGKETMKVEQRIHDPINGRFIMEVKKNE